MEILIKAKGEIVVGTSAATEVQQVDDAHHKDQVEAETHQQVHQARGLKNWFFCPREEVFCLISNRGD